MPRVPTYQRQNEFRGNPVPLANVHSPQIDTGPTLVMQGLQAAAHAAGVYADIRDRAKAEDMKLQAAQVEEAKLDIHRKMDEQRLGTIDPLTGLKNPGLLDRTGKDAVGTEQDATSYFDKISAEALKKMPSPEAARAFQSFIANDREEIRSYHAGRTFNELKAYQDTQVKGLESRAMTSASDTSIPDTMAESHLNDSLKGTEAAMHGQPREAVDAELGRIKSNWAYAKFSAAPDYASKKAAHEKYGGSLQGDQAVKARETLKHYGIDQIGQDESDKLRNELGDNFTKGAGYAAIIAKADTIKNSEHRDSFVKQATLQWNQQNAVKRQQISDLGEQAISISAQGGKVPDALHQELLKTIEGTKYLDDAENVRYKLNKPDPQRIQQLNTMTPAEVGNLSSSAAIAYRESLPPEQQKYFDTLQRQGAQDKLTLDGVKAKADGAASAETVKTAMERRDKLRSNLYQMAGAKESSNATPEQAALQTRLAMQFDRMVSAIQAQKKGTPLTEADVNSAFLQFSSQVKNSKDGSTKKLFELMRDSWKETGDSMPITGAINRGDWVVHSGAGDFMQEAGVTPIELQQMAKNQGMSPDEYVNMRNAQAIGFTSEEEMNSRRLVRTEEQMKEAAHNVEKFGGDKVDLVTQIDSLAGPMLKRTDLSELEIKQLSQMMILKNDINNFDWLHAKESDIKELRSLSQRKINTKNFDPKSIYKGAPANGLAALYQYITK